MLHACSMHAPWMLPACSKHAPRKNSVRALQRPTGAGTHKDMWMRQCAVLKVLLANQLYGLWLRAADCND